MESIAAQVLAMPAQETQAPVASTEIDSVESYINSLNPQAEPKAEEVKEEVKQEDPRLALIAKMERKIKLQEQALKQKEQEFEAKFGKYKEYEESDKDFATNPFKFLNAKGLDMEKLNKLYLETAADDDLDPVSRKFKDFDSKLEQTKAELRKEYEEKLKAKEEEIKKKEFDNQISQFKSEIKSFIATNKDEFELINAEDNGADTLYDIIYHDLQNQLAAGKEGADLVPMDIKVAATKLETYLDSHVQKYLNLKKYKPKQQVEENQLEGLFKQSNTPKTISDSFTPKSVSVDQLTDEERIKAATDLVKQRFNF